MANKLSKKKTTVQKVVKKQKPVVEAAAHDKAVRPQVTTVAIPTGEYVSAVGRRKTATARVRIYKEAGDFVVNGRLVSDYFRNITHAPSLYNLPLVTADVQGKYAISVKVEGSGIRSQVDAVNHAVSRALIKMNPDLRIVLKKRGLLSRDDRMKETRKVGTGGKARRTKQSPKR
jgi:small subunit ribosomal protein S9